MHFSWNAVVISIASASLTCGLHVTSLSFQVSYVGKHRSWQTVRSTARWRRALLGCMKGRVCGTGYWCSDITHMLWWSKMRLDLFSAPDKCILDTFYVLYHVILVMSKYFWGDDGVELCFCCFFNDYYFLFFSTQFFLIQQVSKMSAEILSANYLWI